jgi:hypothetical protein
LKRKKEGSGQPIFKQQGQNNLFRRLVLYHQNYKYKVGMIFSAQKAV